MAEASLNKTKSIKEQFACTFRAVAERRGKQTARERTLSFMNRSSGLVIVAALMSPLSAFD
jgi:hypothetical protein